MDVDRFLAELKDAPGYSGQIVHLHEEPARAAVSAAAPVELGEAARRALSARGIDTLYSHQAQALSLAASGANILIHRPAQ